MALHEHPPHAQVDASHVSVPCPPPHVCVEFAAHAPCPVQLDQLEYVPLLQVRDCVPQLPHVCVAAPEHGQAPAVHVDPLGHAVPQAPQLLLSVCSLTHVVPQSVVPPPQEHVPHVHDELHVCVPCPPPQVCDVVGEHTPCVLQVDQLDQVPELHVRVCVPQLPHACEDAPWHWQALP